MPPRHTSEFRVHVFDLDAWGALPHQRAAALSAAGGVGCVGGGWGSTSSGTSGRERSGSCGAPSSTISPRPRTATLLEVRTWVSDLRRARSQREYEAVAPGDATLAARAATDWAYVDNTGSRRRAGAAARGTCASASPGAATVAHRVRPRRRQPPSHRTPSSCRAACRARRDRPPSRFSAGLTPTTRCTPSKPSTTRWLRTGGASDPAQRAGTGPTVARHDTGVLRGNAASRGHLARHRLDGRCHRRRLRNGMHPRRADDGTRVLHASTRWRHAPDCAPAEPRRGGGGPQAE